MASNKMPLGWHEDGLTNHQLPAELLAILNAPCPPLPAELIQELNRALNENLEEISEKD